MHKILIRILIILGVVFTISACAGGTSPVPTAVTLLPTSLLETAPSDTQAAVLTDTSPAPAPTETLPTTAPPSTSAQPTGFPAPPTGVPEDALPNAEPLGSLVAFAWNNLGMHCYRADYSQFLILPPHNVFWTQVVARGEDPPIITDGLIANYYLPQETDPAAHTNFWDYAADFGWDLQPGIGLNGKGISGTLDASIDHFIAEGVPVVDVNDNGIWDPYPFFVVQVKDNAGKILASTVNIAPASTEMSCYLCHIANDIQGVFANILNTHDILSKTSLVSQAQGGKLVLCNSCHADPAMGVMDNQNSQATLSGAIHTFHTDKLIGTRLP